jgi:hypothetical protein
MLVLTILRITPCSIFLPLAVFDTQKKGGVLGTTLVHEEALGRAAPIPPAPAAVSPE